MSNLLSHGQSHYVGRGTAQENYLEGISMRRLFIQIPALNESSALPVVLRSLPGVLPGIDDIHILLIDDGSADNTAHVALENGADFVIRHRINRGLSSSFITGIQSSLALGADIIVNTDADNQYPGDAIARLIAPIIEGKADIVIGDRQPHKNSNFSKTKSVLENFGSWVVRFVSGTDAPDAPSGFRAYSRYAALRIQVHNQYSYTLETLIQAGREKMKIVHVPIMTNRTDRPSRLHKGFLHFIWKQGGAILRSYVLYQPLKTFLSLGMVFLVPGAFLLLRFVALFLLGDSGIGRYVQSVSIGGTLSVFGLLMMVMGFIGDAIRANRQILTETQAALRDQRITAPYEAIHEIHGEPVYSRYNNEKPPIE